MHPFRSHACAALNAANTGQTVHLSGRVHRLRDHGGVLFIDLRDHYWPKAPEARAGRAKH